MAKHDTNILIILTDFGLVVSQPITDGIRFGKCSIIDVF